MPTASLCAPDPTVLRSSPPSPSGPVRAPDPESRAWVDGLSAHHVLRERKLTELHDLTRRAARHEVARRRSWVRADAMRNLDDLVEEIAADAVLLIVDRLNGYRGESRFTTWAYAFVMNVTSAKLARIARRPRLSEMDDSDWDRLPDQLSPEPQDRAESREILNALRRGVEQKLTPHQRRVFVDVALNTMPIDQLAERLGSNRNAIYKTLFDARRKLRIHLEAAGYQISPTRPPAALAG